MSALPLHVSHSIEQEASSLATLQLGFELQMLAAHLAIEVAPPPTDPTDLAPAAVNLLRAMSPLMHFSQIDNNNLAALLDAMAVWQPAMPGGCMAQLALLQSTGCMGSPPASDAEHAEHAEDEEADALLLGARGASGTRTHLNIMLCAASYDSSLQRSVQSVAAALAPHSVLGSHAAKLLLPRLQEKYRCAREPLG
jgi:hypothetical protein